MRPRARVFDASSSTEAHDLIDALAVAACVYVVAVIAFFVGRLA